VLVEPLLEKNSGSKMIEPNSAIEAATITSWPKLLPISPESVSTGTIAPGELATNTIATNGADWTNSPALRPSPSAVAIANDTAKPIDASLRIRPRRHARSISRPIRKSRNASPTRARIETGRSALTQPKPEGPITMPTTISSTIAGSRTRGKKPSASGARSPAATTISRFVK
jgi:hypothetical protein